MRRTIRQDTGDDYHFDIWIGEKFLEFSDRAKADSDLRERMSNRFGCANGNEFMSAGSGKSDGGAQTIRMIAQECKTHGVVVWVGKWAGWDLMDGPPSTTFLSRPGLISGTGSESSEVHPHNASWLFGR